METIETVAQAMTRHGQNGKLDRMAGSAIQTKAQYKEAYPELKGEDFDDMYRAYCTCYRKF